MVQSARALPTLVLRILVLAAILFPLVPGPADAVDLQAWDQVIPNAATRFKILPAFGNAAVLDRETQRVWERTAATATPTTWVEAQTHCYTREVGGRMGWRLPTIEELTSLIDPSQPEGAVKLPPGHPFEVGTTNYWSSTTSAGNPDAAWFVRLASGDAQTALKIAPFRSWCVRGGHGHDAH